jgi:hypothetical protein
MGKDEQSRQGDLLTMVIWKLKYAKGRERSFPETAPRNPASGGADMWFGPAFKASM